MPQPFLLCKRFFSYKVKMLCWNATRVEANLYLCGIEAALTDPHGAQIVTM